MNPHERLAIWQQHLANARASLADIGERFSGLSFNETASIRASWKSAVKTAQGFVGYYEEKIANNA